jgi:hypothetical protein
VHYRINIFTPVRPVVKRKHEQPVVPDDRRQAFIKQPADAIRQVSVQWDHKIPVYGFFNPGLIDCLKKRNYSANPQIQGTQSRFP